MTFTPKPSAVANLPSGCFDDVKTHTFYKIQEVCAIVKKSRSAIYRAIARGEFVAPVRTGKRSVVWTAASIAEWQEACIQASKKAQG